MAKLSEYTFVASIFMTGLALVLYLSYAISGLRAARLQTAGGPGTSGSIGLISGPRTAAIGRYATLLTWLATVTLLASLVFRAIVTGHGPFANMYEFSMAFAFGILVTYLYFERKYHQRILALIALPVALGMLLYAATIPADIEPLVPALQNNLLLTVHVATAIVAYGSFAIAFAASYLFLRPDRVGADDPVGHGRGSHRGARRSRHRRRHQRLRLRHGGDRRRAAGHGDRHLVHQSRGARRRPRRTERAAAAGACRSRWCSTRSATAPWSSASRSSP